MIDFDATSKQLAKMAKDNPKNAARALYETLEEDLPEVKRRTPVDKGNLRSTEHVTLPEIKPGEISASIVAGGPAAPYARSQHENLTYRHKVGQAKFIESVMRERMKDYPSRIARKL